MISLDTSIDKIIEFKEINKSYKDITALQEVSFSIRKGEIFGYIGPNGAGKTTTLKILVGLIQDYQGELVINGKLATNRKTTSKLIGYLPQDVGFQEWRTVDHALTTFGLLSGLTREDLTSKIPETLEIVGLTEARKRKIRHLSGGMKQKLKLAQALLHNPQILVLDEPMSGLDPTSRWQMRLIIQELAKREITIIFSSHILGDVEDIADRIGIIHQGKVVKIGRSSELQGELEGGERVEVIGKNLQKYVKEISKLEAITSVDYSDDFPDKLLVFLNSEITKEEGLSVLLDFIARNNIVVSNFNYLKPSLEQVYLRYVNGGLT